MMFPGKGWPVSGSLMTVAFRRGLLGLVPSSSAEKSPAMLAAVGTKALLLPCRFSDGGSLITEKEERPVLAVVHAGDHQRAADGSSELGALELVNPGGEEIACVEDVIAQEAECIAV